MSTSRESAGERAPRAAGSPSAPRIRWSRRAGIWIAVLLAVAVAVRYAPRMLYLLEHVSTDDAYVQGHTIVPIAPQVKGRVVDLRVTDDQDVSRGDLLLAIEPADYEVALAKADANAVREEARLANARIARARAALLSRKHIAPRQQLDDSEASEREAEARLRAARAAVDAAQLDLQRTRLIAPVSGRVAMRNVQLGSYVEVGQQLFALVDLTDLYVRANFKETQIGDLRIGQPADLEVDAYPGIVFQGFVASFQPGTGSVFSMLPPENATGQFVKVVQRLPVRIAIALRRGDPVLYPGLSVTARIDTHAQSELDARAQGGAP